MNNLILDLLAFGAIISGILVITSKNPIIAVVFLILLFINAAGYLILSGITFVGISYIVLYVGAITVLFLFVIMMLNIELSDIIEVGSHYTKNLPLAIVVGSLFIFEIYSIIPTQFLKAQSSFPQPSTVDKWDVSLVNSVSVVEGSADLTIFKYLQIESLGQTLYTTNAFWLILISFILLLSMIAPIIISRKI